jgi:hypothetical protein
VSAVVRIFSMGRGSRLRATRQGVSDTSKREGARHEQPSPLQRVATVYESCEACEMDIRRLETLFPTGYHRGAVKLAGLRMWF